MLLCSMQAMIVEMSCKDRSRGIGREGEKGKRRGKNDKTGKERDHRKGSCQTGGKAVMEPKIIRASWKRGGAGKKRSSQFR
jgi:hypothetical protein